MNLGKDVAKDEAGVKAALEGAGAPTGKVLIADVRPSFSYVIVAEEDVAGFEAVNGRVHGEKPLKLERAKK